jgi:hypothetical protein
VVDQADGTGTVGVELMVEAKDPVQVVDVGQCLVGTMGTAQGVREVEFHSSKAVAERVHWVTEEQAEATVEVSVVVSAPARPA